MSGYKLERLYLFWITLITVFLTPAFKISIQNIGVGDGLIIFLTILISTSSSYLLIAASFFFMAIWHPQQSFFIGISYLLALYCYMGELKQKELFTALGSLSIAAMTFFLYKISLNFNYNGREAYMANHISEFLHRNLIYAPIAFAPTVIWFLFFRVKVREGKGLLLLWLFGLAFVSLLTTDVTRVITITSLPIVAIGAKKILMDKVSIPYWKLIFVGVLIALIPPFSWSRLDYFLWTDLVSDLCKWRFHCW